jgi:hypothetical protein
MVKGWLRDKESLTCQEGYPKKRKMHLESQEDMEVEAGTARADLLSNHRL